MHRLLSALILSAVVTILPLGSGGALARSRAHVSPKYLVLTARDLPRTFRLVAARSLSNAAAERGDRLPPGTYARHGRITSYETTFRRSGFHVFSVDDTVIAFKSAGGAHWEFVRLASRGRGTQGAQRFHPLRVGRIGDEAAGYRLEERSGGYPITCGIAIFRRGSYAAWVITCGLTGVYPITESPALARIIDRHIRSAA